MRHEREPAPVLEDGGDVMDGGVGGEERRMEACGSGMLLISREIRRYQG